MKQYIEKVMKGIDNQIADTQKKRKNNKIIYNVATGIASVLGVCLLFGTPWLGVSLIGGAISLQLSRKTTDHNLEVTEKALNKQKSHINDTLSKKVDPMEAISTQKRKNISTLEEKSKIQDAQYKSSVGTQQFLRALVAGTILAVGFFPNPLVSVATFGSVWLKHTHDLSNSKKHDQLEDTVCELNNSIHDYNIGVKKVQSGNANQRRRVEQTTPTKQQSRIPTRRPVRRVSKEEEEAVEAYLRSLEAQQTTNNTVRRRV